MKFLPIPILFILAINVVSGQYFANPRIGFEYYQEFMAHVNADVVGRDLYASNAGSGASTGALLVSSQINALGVAVSSTGTTATGRASLLSNNTFTRFGGGKWVWECRIDSLSALSTSGQRYTIQCGFLDNVTVTTQTDAVYFLYDEGGVSTGSAASANWQTVTCNNGTRTFTTTSSAVVLTGTTLRIEINPDGSQVDFYINGIHTGTSHTTNIPTQQGRETGIAMTINKSVGNTACWVGWDYLHVTCRYTKTK